MKKCSKCKTIKPLDLFHRDASSVCGRRSRCKECTSLYKRVGIGLSDHKDTPSLRAGARYGEWSLQFPFLARKGNGIFAYCLCGGCGLKYWVDYLNIKKGLSKRCLTCGHEFARKNRLLNTWGKVPSKLEQICFNRWSAIYGRCENPKSRGFPDYGARGIKLSKEFMDGRVFSEYAASLPGADASLEIDRIDNDKGYERGNIKWSTRKQQSRNTRASCKLVFCGETVCARTWAENYSKFTPQTVTRLSKIGLTGEEILAREMVMGKCPRKRRAS